jgi:hypothetical protein
MKTKIPLFLITFIVIGLVLSSFTFTPYENSRENPKSMSYALSLSPPSPWQLHIYVLDPPGSCNAQYCNLYFFIQPATVHCEGVLAIPPTKVKYDQEQRDYYVNIDDSIPCIYVSIVDLEGTCQYPFNSNTCCECKTDNQVCRLHICPQ